MRLIDADDFGKWLQNRGESWRVSENGERYNELGYVWNELERRASKSKETAPSVSSNSVTYAVAQLVTDFITNHDLTDIQSITMRNFLDWVALQHT